MSEVQDWLRAVAAARATGVGTCLRIGYRGTVWQIILLAELGADPADERVRRGCEYLLNHSIAANGAFSAYKKPVPKSHGWPMRSSSS